MKIKVNKNESNKINIFNPNKNTKSLHNIEGDEALDPWIINDIIHFPEHNIIPES